MKMIYFMFLIIIFYVSHHNIDSYNKTAWLETSKKLAESLKLFLGNRFRSDNDVQRILFSLDAVYSGNAVLKIVSDPKPWRKALNFFKNVEWESYMDNDDSDKLQEEILKFKPKFFCINSGNTCSKERKIKIKNFLECLFPAPSKFEL